MNIKKLFSVFVVLFVFGITNVHSQTYNILSSARANAIADAERNLLPNGCGSKDSFNSYFIPDGSWVSACNQHDIDYGTIGMSKAEADRRLKANMKSNGAPDWVASFYVWALDNRIGQAAYDEAQAQAKRINGLKNSSFPEDNPYSW